MKKLTLIILLIFGFLYIFTNLINGFQEYKGFYASFYPAKYYQKDNLLYDYEINPSSKTTYYLYNGTCESDKLIYGITIPAYVVENQNFYSNRINKKIPIWRVRIAKKIILYRNKKNKIHSPFSWEMRNYWMGTIFSILFIPSLFYYFYLKNRNKSK